MERLVGGMLPAKSRSEGHRAVLSGPTAGRQFIGSTAGWITVREKRGAPKWKSAGQQSTTVSSLWRASGVRVEAGLFGKGKTPMNRLY